ncbi:MAG TPA: hypothetical protein VNI56_04285 [Xanthomonadaceae bacterium]|nr:hypothetical protein [Xanthomonadaceae bacterium]
MRQSRQSGSPSLLLLALSLSAALLGGCAYDGRDRAPEAMVASDGAANQGVTFPREDGNATAGREVFRFETFGNEGFWTDAVRLLAGMMAAKVTPLKALELGVQIDMEALYAATMRTLMEQLRADPSGRSSALLNDPATLAALINANAVIGMPVKDSNRDGRMDVASGDKVGASCALCHTVTDQAVLSLPNGGSIGRRRDGLANHNLDMGAIFASAANSRALYPVLQLSLTANKGKTLGRAPKA